MSADRVQVVKAGQRWTLPGYRGPLTVVGPAFGDGTVLVMRRTPPGGGHYRIHSLETLVNVRRLDLLANGTLLSDR